MTETFEEMGATVVAEEVALDHRPVLTILELLKKYHCAQKKPI